MTTNYQKELKIYKKYLQELQLIKEESVNMIAELQDKREKGLIGNKCFEGDHFSSHNDLEVFVNPIRKEGIIISGGMMCYCRAVRLCISRLNLEPEEKPRKT